jgi:hypothetical protein
MRHLGDIVKKEDSSFELSASDLVGYLNCRHLSALERAVAEGAVKKPYVWDPLLKILWERGSIKNNCRHASSASPASRQSGSNWGGYRLRPLA